MHFVVTHGLCHGAWVWYKVKPRVEAAGHWFTAVDLAACGANPKKLDEVRSVYDSTVPLLEVLDLLPPDEKVVLVGHSGGGIGTAIAMEKYPEKISLAIYLAGMMPDTTHEPSYVLDQYFRGFPPDAWMDTQFSAYGDPKEPLTSLIFGPELLKSTIYQLCPVEDFTLAAMTVRPGSFFLEDLRKTKKFTDERFGSVARVYIVCKQDKAIPAEFQHWMIENNPVKEVRVMEVGHMPMFSAPDQLCQCLLEIADKHTREKYLFLGNSIASSVVIGALCILVSTISICVKLFFAANL